MIDNAEMLSDIKLLLANARYLYRQAEAGKMLWGGESSNYGDYLKKLIAKYDPE